MAVTYTVPFLHKRGTASKVALYSGPAGELVVDTTNNTVVVQNATAGGVPLAKASTKIIAGNGIAVTGGTLGVDTTISLAPLKNSLGQTVTAGTYGQATNASPNAGGTIYIPYLVIDSNGRITEVGQSNIVLPAGGSGTTTVSAQLYVGNNASTTDGATTNGNTYLILNGGSSYYRKRIMGTNSISVSSNASGEITIDGPNMSLYATQQDLNNALTQTGQVLSTIYMSPSGNDSNDGSTSSTAIRTPSRLREILTTVRPGASYGATDDTSSILKAPIVQVVFAAGTYDYTSLSGNTVTNFDFRFLPFSISFVPLGNVTINFGDAVEYGLSFYNTTLFLGGLNAQYVAANNTITTVTGSFSFNKTLQSAHSYFVVTRPLNCVSINLYDNTSFHATVSDDSGGHSRGDLTLSGRLFVSRSSAAYINSTVRSAQIGCGEHSFIGLYQHKNSSATVTNSITTGYVSATNNSIIYITAPITVNNSLAATPDSCLRASYGAMIKIDSDTGITDSVKLIGSANLKESNSLAAFIDLFGKAFIYLGNISLSYANTSASFQQCARVGVHCTLSANYINATAGVKSQTPYGVNLSTGAVCAGLIILDDNSFVANSSTNRTFPGSESNTYTTTYNTSLTLVPDKTDARNLGRLASESRDVRRWKNIYLSNTPNTESDARFKTDVIDIPEGILMVWGDLKYKCFRFTSPNSDRLHVGFIAQDVEAAFQRYGLDPTYYSFFCMDKVADNDFVYSLRYTDMLIIEAAYQRNKVSALEARLAALEAKVG